jgi:hypothetical protein
MSRPPSASSPPTSRPMTTLGWWGIRSTAGSIASHACWRPRRRASRMSATRWTVHVSRRLCAGRGAPLGERHGERRPRRGAPVPRLGHEEGRAVRFRLFLSESDPLRAAGLPP